MLQAGDPPRDEAPDGADRPGRARGADGAPYASGVHDRERLAVFDAAVADVAARVEPAYGQADGWLEQTRAGLKELLRFCDERPDTARELVVESIAWGPEVLRRRGQLLDALAEAMDRGCARADSIAGDTTQPAPLPGTAENLVGACVSLVHTRLLQAGGGSFLVLVPSLMSMIAHPYLGPEAARHELERSLRYAGTEASGRKSEGDVAGISEKSY